jgi:PAS domain S-box-containing protein
VRARRDRDRLRRRVAALRFIDTAMALTQGTEPHEVWPGRADEGRSARDLLEALWDAPIGIAVIDRPLRWVRFNPTFARMMGEPAEQHLGRRVDEVIGGTGLVGVEELGRTFDSGVASPGRAVSGEWPPGSGDVRYWVTSYHPVHDQEGVVVGAALVAVDVTERQRQEDAHRREHREEERAIQALVRLQAITAALAAAATPDEVARVILEEGVGLLDASAGSISRTVGSGELAVLDACGYPDTTLVAWRRYDVELPAPLAEAFRTGRPVWVESPAAYAARYPQTAAACRAFPEGASAAVPLLVRGVAIGVLGLDFAVPTPLEPTDRSLIQALAQECAQALERARLYEEQALLRASAEKTAALLDTLFSSVPIGLAFVDWDLRFVHANAAWARLYGIAPEACVGKSIGELLPAQGAERGNAWRRVLANGEPVVEVELSGADASDPGVVRSWLESWYPVVAGGQTIGLGLVARDVTDLKRADAFRRSVLGVVGHDLRNPLAAILGYARVLARDENLDERQRGMLSRIDVSTSKAVRIVGDLLDLTRLESTRAMPIDVRTTRVDEICRAVVEEAAAVHPGREIRVEGRGDPLVEWDPDRVSQLLSNLLVNALRHGAADRPVSIDWAATAKAVAVDVHNWGAPIPPELRAHLFEPFRRGAQPAARGPSGGLGLGLYIAREIARAHGGEIAFTSSEAEGTAFTIRLPRRVVSSA